MASPGKKAFALRIDPALWAEIERLAAQELRSANAQVEFPLDNPPFATRDLKGFVPLFAPAAQSPIDLAYWTEAAVLSEAGIDALVYGPGDIAQAAQDGPSHGTRLRAFLVVWRTALRLQIAGLVGNLVVAGPLALLIDLSVKHVTGSHLLTEAKAHHVLVSQSILGPSALFAAIKGVFLWISSLTSAASDEKSGLIARSSVAAENLPLWSIRTASVGSRPWRKRTTASTVSR